MNNKKPKQNKNLFTSGVWWPLFLPPLEVGTVERTDPNADMLRNAGNVKGIILQ